MSQLQITCQYMQFGQSACMFHISYGLQWRQGLRYIAVTCTLPLKSGNDDITTFLAPLKVHRWLSGAGEFHPYALQDPYVTVSRHTAPTVQPMAGNQIPKTQIISVHGVQCDPTSGSF